MDMTNACLWKDGPIVGALGEAASARLHSGSPVPHRLHHHNRFVSFHKWGLCHIPICRIKCGGVYYRTSHILRLSLMSFFFFRELRPSRDRLEQQHNRAERESGIGPDSELPYETLWDIMRHLNILDITSFSKNVFRRCSLLFSSASTS